ncbi:DUF5106 domain-containing protein [uncultured Parabacteroides sp.]|uniref:DUF5106 domain-containing protein n=1 Tax=Parabacteroides sp. AF17-28 TaxID=2292241 RepID=UPI000EFFBE83|nr:DUF5106 domain-containing protein [uncultured Parabacteroides sp.]RHR55856.1 DUF5106 domain-containing protein [Parabacteroides sp. AF17-28]
MRIKVLHLLSFMLIFSACNGQQPKKMETENTKERTFEMVSVPSVITEPEKRAAYLVTHYWDKFDFTDTTLIHLPEITEQAASNYIDMMKYVSPATAASSIKDMMHKAAVDSTMFAYFAGLYEKYLYDPNSPMRDESLYIPVLEAVLEAPVFDEVHKVRPAHLLEVALKNRIGEPATDFTYTLADGKKGTLYHVKADYLLLFFYNPDCHACKEITDQLAASPIVNGWIKNNKLKILAVYPDEDLDAWRNHISYMPASWINSYDSTVSLKNDEIYDLKAIPTLYLLDKDKKVILKDVTFNQIENYLQQ